MIACGRTQASRKSKCGDRRAAGRRRPEWDAPTWPAWPPMQSRLQAPAAWACTNGRVKTFGPLHQDPTLRNQGSRSFRPSQATRSPSGPRPAGSRTRAPEGPIAREARRIRANSPSYGMSRLSDHCIEIHGQELPLLQSLPTFPGLARGSRFRLIFFPSGRLSGGCSARRPRPFWPCKEMDARNTDPAHPRKPGEVSS